MRSARSRPGGGWPRSGALDILAPSGADRRQTMSDWLHGLPVIWMVLVVFGVSYLFTVLIQMVVGMLAVGERLHAFKAVSPGMLPPLGIIFGLFVAFTAAQVWNDTERATTAVNREASALRSIAV